ncbi:MAG: tetratricopeptide repeat protein [Spirochaetaceae bacterium]|nr:tetratricopeptide repeat protein [Spirochaetaceae bacterium]
MLTCSGKTPPDKTDFRRYYLNKTSAQKEVLKELFSLLAQKNNSDDENFSIVREIANQYRRLNDNYRIINFLSEWVHDHTADPYNSYYLLRIATCYLREDSKAIAALYFDLIVRNYPDLIVRGESIHLACLRQLITLVDNPGADIWYYEKLISRFPDKIDLGQAYFMLGQAEEKNGNRDSAIKAYKNFMPFYGAIIPGFPDAYAYAKQVVDFYNAEKYYNTQTAKFDRTFENLAALISVIKRTLDDGDTLQLWRYRARVNFFARSWTQVGMQDEDLGNFSISTLSSSGKIQYAADLSKGSGSNDAYLRTWGWSKLTPIWYFYFRKIYFPIDPEIHGRWEWAGIYYGERF